MKDKNKIYSTKDPNNGVGTTKNIAKIILINILVCYIIVSLIIIIPPIYKTVENHINAAIDYDDRVNIPSLSKYPWIKTYFQESKKITNKYYDFVGWRSDYFNGEIINIDSDGYRRDEAGNALFKSDIWFFGGSTMWGTGVPDKFTIPQYYYEKTGNKTFNLGTSGYTAHQSLNLLMKNYLLGGRPDLVIFYDGVNDVAQKCRIESDYYSTSRQNQIRTALLNSKYPLTQLVTPSFNIFKELFNRTNQNLSGNSFYDCNTNQIKGRLVARALLYDWLFAKQIVEQNGGTFYPVLQPVSYIGNPNISYLESVKNNNGLRLQFKFVYDEIRKLAKEMKIEYIDLTDAFDGDKMLYFDFCHVNPEGNNIIAEKLVQIIN